MVHHIELFLFSNKEHTWIITVLDLFRFSINLGTSGISNSWRESLNLCKTKELSYLTGNISLSNLTQACEDANQNDTTPRWVGVVKDTYMNFDKGIHDITF